MKNIIKSIPAVILIFLMCTSCANLPVDGKALAGISVKDLEEACSGGKEKTFSLSYAAAFDKVTKILRKNELTIFQSDKKKGYIVAMGFPRQINTTRVGIFFESLDDDNTKLTLSSLSSTSLVKAETIVFGGLEN